MSVRHYRDHPAVCDLLERSLPHTARATTAQRNRARRIYALGVRPVFELIAEMQRRLNADAWLDSRLNAYASMRPDMVELVGANDWPDAPELAVIDGGRK